MKLERNKNQVTQSDDFDTKSIGISAENMDLAFQELISYSNPIGSIIREITSNCFDAHVDAGVDEPPLIRLSDGMSSNQTFIDFVDFGDGMSEEKIENIYGSLYESDKRDSNNKIGAFGIGSKSPLAYCDTYILSTVHNGSKRSYWIYNHGQGFNITKFSEEEPEEGERTGTMVRVPIKDSTMEVSKFKGEIKKQLAYFRKVNIEGFDIEDNEIIEANNFIVSKWASDRKSDLTLCLGEVLYDLREDVIKDKFDSKFPNMRFFDIDRVNIGIKMEIGEVPVTSKREDVKYTDDAIDKITDRIREAIDELMDIYRQRNTVNNIQEMVNVEMFDVSSMHFGNVKVRLPMMSHDKGEVRHTKYPDINIRSAMNFLKIGAKQISNGRNYPEVQYLNKDLSDMYRKVKSYDRGLSETPYYNHSGTQVNRTNNLALYLRGDTPVVVYTIPSDLSWIYNVDQMSDELVEDIYRIMRYENMVKKQNGKALLSTRDKLSANTKIITQLYNFYQDFLQVFKEKGIDYHAIEPTESELEHKSMIDGKINDYKVQRKEEITVKTPVYYPNLADGLKFEMDNYTPNALRENFKKTGLVVYGTSDDRTNLFKAFGILNFSKHNSKGDREDGYRLRNMEVMQVAKNNVKKLLRYLPCKAMHVDEYLKGVHHTFRRFMTACYLSEMVNTSRNDSLNLNMHRLTPYDVQIFDDRLINHGSHASADIDEINALQSELIEFIHRYSNTDAYGGTGSLVREVYKDNYIKFIEHNMWYKDIPNKLLRLKEYAFKYPLLVNLEYRRVAARGILSDEDSDTGILSLSSLTEGLKQYMNIVPNRHVHPRFFQRKSQNQDQDG